MNRCSKGTQTLHAPVMVREMLHAIQPRSGCVYLDGTLGAGGYAQAILEASHPSGRVIGLDLDIQAVRRAAFRLGQYAERFTEVHGGFHESRRILNDHGIDEIHGAVLDLGMSSDQLDAPERGFSFRLNGPLDMRFNTSSGETILDYLGHISMKELEEILATYGEERYCKRLARGLHDERLRGRLSTTNDLANVVERILGKRRGKIHPATRTFQALRIALNREMENLQAGLDQIPELMALGARLCVVSYHSLEDRLVKNSFRERSKAPHRWKVVTPKPLRPTAEEARENSRSRSARMRVLEAVGA